MENGGFTGGSDTEDSVSRTKGGVYDHDDEKKAATIDPVEIKAQTSEKPPPLLGSSRFALSVIACFGFIHVYAMNVDLAAAMVCMVNQTALDERKSDVLTPSMEQRPTTCRSEVDEYRNSTTLTKKDGEFAWSKEIQGYVLGSFFWGYLMTQVLGGWLAARYGGKRVYGYALLICSMATLLMVVSARADYKALMLMRMIAGASQGVVWPAMTVMWTKWAPPLESGKLTGLSYAGSQIGNVVTFALAGQLCEYGFDGGWASLFYLLGISGVLWFCGWMYIVYDSPEEHPRASYAEKRYIRVSVKGYSSLAEREDRTTPWFAILTSPRVWAIVVTHTSANWGTYTFLTNTPTYMKEVLYFDVKENGLFSALPYIGFGATIYISGALYDLVVSRGLLDKTTARKAGNSIGLMVPCVSVIGLSFMDCTHSTEAVALLVVGVAMSGFSYGAGFLTNPAQLTPRYAGIIFGISNTLGTLPGICVPIMIGYLTTDRTQEQWQTVFFIAAAAYAFGTLFFITFSSSELQPWDKPEQKIQVDAQVENVFRIKITKEI